MAITIQTGAHQYNDSNLQNYSLMMGGLNVTRGALDQYDPLVTGYYRLFMVRKPISLLRQIQPNLTILNIFLSMEILVLMDSEMLLLRCLRLLVVMLVVHSQFQQ